ncbi:mechanosensitive ion channel family protein [Stappia sp. ES.058]|uniref:mechanosensitive ion channel family protein n=1 Tax=Stappia sp. ES.058 TaxID=1881061 RepID=UPI00087C0B39|nr:mechanosensitive ion channel family protein [Stappia sp. ES.058]SDU27691.1 Small-conductance mechanosensitive channel [Stappia sp. ES.058]
MTCGSGSKRCRGFAVVRFLVLAFLVFGSFATQAQTTAPQGPSPAPAAVAGSAGAGASMGGVDYRALAFEARDAFGRALQSLDAFPQLATQALLEHSPDGTLGWLFKTVVVLLISIVAGAAALTLTERWGHHRFLGAYDLAPSGRAVRIGFLFTRAAVMGLALVVFAVVAGGVVLTGVSAHTPSRVSALTGLETVLAILLVRIVFLNILVPGASVHRPLHLRDEDARGLYLSLMGVAVVAYAVIGLCAWMAEMGLDENAHKLALIATTTLTCLALSIVAIAYRKPLAGLVAGPEDGRAQSAAWRRVLTLVWLPATVLYFLGAMLVSNLRVLLDMPAAMGLVGAPIFSLLIFAVLYSLMLLVIDKWLLPRLDRADLQEKIVGDLVRAAASDGESVDPDAVRAQAQAETLEAEAARSPYRGLLDHGAAIVALVVAVGHLMATWGVPLTGDASPVTNLFEIGIILFLGHMAYRAVALAIDHQIRQEGGASGKNDEDHEIGGHGESRLATLLPIFRNFLLISIVATVGMIALSHMGVNIAPLFAGAGVVGLAVGFGAQTLIRDIFSGAFFLADDAFRKGEYIDIGNVKGTVEKISIRSMQLRHHNGPLNTIPFGEIKFVKNFSRDWAVMKLAFRVTYDTDVEKMRKLIKKFGQQLLEHPDYGPKFLQQVKSQGVTALEDSAMIVRVKFMTRPGDQFELRKVVYAGIRDLCEREGIHFAHRQVTVRVSQDPSDPREFSEAEKKAIGGAVVPTLEEGQGPQGRSAPNDGL